MHISYHLSSFIYFISLQNPNYPFSYYILSLKVLYVYLPWWLLLLYIFELPNSIYQLSCESFLILQSHLHDCLLFQLYINSAATPFHRLLLTSILFVNFLHFTIIPAILFAFPSLIFLCISPPILHTSILKYLYLATISNISFPNTHSLFQCNKILSPYISWDQNEDHIISHIYSWSPKRSSMPLFSVSYVWCSKCIFLSISDTFKFLPLTPFHHSKIY